MAAISTVQSAKSEFTVSRSHVDGNSWTFTPVTSAARQWAVEATDFGLPDGKGSYSVQDTFAPQELQRLHDEEFGVRFVTDHGQDLILDAALCIWEAMLEARRVSPVEREARKADPAEGAEWQAQLDHLWEQVGTVQMRRYAADLAPEFLHVYDGLGGSDTLEELNLTPYDWEFIPAVLAHVEWESYGPSMNIQGVIAAMRDLHSPAPALAPMTRPFEEQRMTAATRDFTVARSQNGGHTWTFTPVSSAARQQAIDFGLPDGKGSYSVLDTFAAQELQRLQEEGFGVGFETKHGQELLMEAAVCLWEAMLESKDKSPEEPPNWEDRMMEVWEEVGTAHMRQFAIGLAPAILHVYDGIGGANALPELNLIPYDWMFVPSVLAEVVWHTSGPVLDPQAAIAALLEKNSPSPDLAPMAAGPGGP